MNCLIWVLITKVQNTEEIEEIEKEYFYEEGL